MQPNSRPARRSVRRMLGPCLKRECSGNYTQKRAPAILRWVTAAQADGMNFGLTCLRLIRTIYDSLW
ncbi:hypothetical protein D3C80_2062200 [compost metagenome]